MKHQAVVVPSAAQADEGGGNEVGGALLGLHCRLACFQIRAYSCVWPLPAVQIRALIQLRLAAAAALKPGAHPTRGRKARASVYRAFERPARYGGLHGTSEAHRAEDGGY